MHVHSRIKVVNPAAEESSLTWKPLRLLNFYRIILSGLFLILIVVSKEPFYLGRHDPQLALYVSILYLVFAAISDFLVLRRWPRFLIQLYTQISADIIALTFLMYTSGGVSSALGMLMVVAIAGGSVIMAGRMANMFAAIATIAILTEEIYAQATQAFQASFTQAGMLGTAFFAAATLAYILAKRVRESEALASQRGSDLANLAQLNEHVIQRMQSGILVVDAEDRIRLMNRSAGTMLHIPSITDRQTLAVIAPLLAQQLDKWRHHTTPGHGPQEQSRVFRPLPTAADILPKFMRLGSKQDSDTLIFLEDTAVMAQQAQQMKLASLGRLTASIAHEVRNPLGAISHAGQLLAESPKLDQADLRLTEIICTHCARVNTMIGNVLQLSRREISKPQTFELGTWLDKFLVEFCHNQHLESKDIKVDITPNDVHLYMDPSQFQQVIWNLCQNGIHHCKGYNGHPKMELRGGITRDFEGPFLDVIDHGPGIDPDTAQQIFEPFFTTETNGTGLGLYIARELCEINQARLNYIPVPSGGSCFRINFANPDRH